MKRTTARQIAVQLGFSYVATGDDVEEILNRFFDPEHYELLGQEDSLFAEEPEDQKEYIRESLLLLAEHRDELDGYIQKYSKGWKVHRINQAAAAVMRQAMLEMLYMKDIPAASCINEAVEITKGYAENETVSFVNGVLGAFYSAEIEKKTED